MRFELLADRPQDIPDRKDRRRPVPPTWMAWRETDSARWQADSDHGTGTSKGCFCRIVTIEQLLPDWATDNLTADG